MTRKPATKNYVFFNLFLCASFTFLLQVLEPRPACAGITYICNREIEAQYKAQGVPCWCEGNNVKCSESSGGGGGGKKGLSSKNQMKMQMMQSVADQVGTQLGKALYNWLNDVPTSGHSSPTPEQLAAAREKQEAEMARAKAEWQKKVQLQIRNMETLYEQIERQKVADTKGKILAGLKGLNVDGPGREMSALQQARCSLYWGKMATTAKTDKDIMKFSSFAKNPTEASMAECARELPPEPPMPTPNDKFRIELYENVAEEINMRLPMLEQAKIKQHEAEERIAEIMQKVEELKNRQATVASPEEKQANDDLMAQILREEEIANRLKVEADAGLAAQQMVLDALSDMGNMATSAKK